MWTGAGALNNLTKGKAYVDEHDGAMVFGSNVPPTPESNLIFETIIVGLEQLKASHKDGMKIYWKKIQHK